MSSHRAAGLAKPFYRQTEIDSLASEALASVSLYPASPGPVRIERFVEKYFKLGSVRYEMLHPAILGYTKFEAGEVREIVVSARLCEDPSRVAERRLHTTLAHEAGHGLLHATLFRDAHHPSLFDDCDDVRENRVLCRDGEAGTRYSSKWWEVQANMMIGPLLLPKSLVFEVVRSHTIESVLGVQELPSRKRHTVALELAQVFDVNPIVAQIRLDTLMPPQRNDQLTL